ncbi:MAG TPA: hypothetical protein VF170_13470, partial [Planctomycetaceae bacterium]
MIDPKTAKSPWSHRLLVLFFAALFGLLVFWLIGFVLRDIGTWPGPDYAALERSMLDRQLLARAEALETEIAATDRQIADQKERQRILRESTAASQQTMNQLLEFQRLNLQQGADLTEDERQALAEAEKLFLANQRQYQQLNEEVSRLSGRLRELRDQRGNVEAEIEKRREPVRRRYEALRERHDLKVAAAKLAVLLPLVVAGVLLFLRWRRGLYAPMVHAYGAAVLVRVGMVMHEYFPARYFKYVLILVSIAVVARVLVHLLRVTARPGREWLLRRYREAYERFACPVCDYPIRRGPLRYLPRTRRGPEPPPLPAGSAAADEPYVCPSCGTRLFEECEVCH